MIHGLPRHALVLAAGYGTRLLPLTRECPKPLLPFRGRPLLARTLAVLRTWGVKEVAVNLHHGSNELFAFLRGASSADMHIACSFEPDILGTGGALIRASWFTSDKPFLLVNGDVVLQLDPTPLARAFRKGNPIAAAWVTEHAGPRTVEHRDGRITGFRSREPGRPGTATFCGVQLVSPDVLRYLPGDHFCSVINAYEKAMRHGRPVMAVQSDQGYWADIGTPRQYLDAHRNAPWLPGDRRARAGRVYISPGAVVSRSNNLRNTVVWKGARVTGCDLQDAIVANGVRLSRIRGSGMFQRADTALGASETRLLSRAGVTLDHAVVNAHPARGSGRTYARILARGKTVQLVHYDSSREENHLFVPHTRFLGKTGLRVPEVLAEDSERGCYVMQDLGDCSLEDEWPHLDTAKRERHYRDVLDQVLILHHQGAREARRRRIRLMPAFGPSVYAYERSLFVQEFLSGLHGVEKRLLRAVERELKHLAMRLDQLRPVLVHRDLQSSNVLLYREKPWLIDYQGMRFGPAEYDLASLLYDPYVQLSERLRLRLLRWYVSKAPIQISEENVRAAAVQRLCQACGAFARLGKLPHNERFLRYIPSAMDRLCQLLPAVGGLDQILDCLDCIRVNERDRLSG